MSSQNTDKSNAPELKPCPFCGSHAVFEPRLEYSIIRCVNRFNGRPVNMRTSKHPSFKEAQAAWNTRADGETVAGLVEDLEEVMKRCGPRSSDGAKARAALAAFKGE